MKHSCNLQRPFFEAVQSGAKTVEGRIAKHKFLSIQAGDVIEFQCGEEVVDVEVQRVEHFSTFEEMLQAHGVERVLPGCTVEEGIALYHSFPGYQSEEQSKGVLGFTIKRV